MKRSEVLRWLQDHGGQADYKLEMVSVQNPNYDPDVDPPSAKTMQVKKVTWTAKDKQTLSVLDHGEMTGKSGPQGPDPGMPGGLNTGPEPMYEIVGSDTTPGKEETRTDEAKRNDEQLDRERQKNLAATGHWETDKDRETRENSENDRARQIANDEERNRISSGQLEISQSAEARAAAADARNAGNQQHQQGIEDRRLTLDEDRYNFDREKANKPEVISRPTDEDEQIALFNPATGKVESQNNPLFNAAKTAAKRKQEELALAIQNNKMNADVAAAEYTQWFERNVHTPFMQAAEKRAQATEQRQTMEAQDRRDQYKASFEQDRQKAGLQAGQKAAENEIALQPYRVGAKFGGQMSDAINGLAAGGALDKNASAGVHFTADAFQYKRPNLDAISKKATAAALKHLTSYNPDENPYPTADYSGIAMPDATTMAGAPAAPTLIDTNSMFNDWQNTKYNGPSQ